MADEAGRRVRRVRMRLTTAGVAATTALVIGAVSWALAIDRAPKAQPAGHEGPVPWYAAQQLHLGDLSVHVDEVDSLAAFAGGAAYLDGDGAVTWLQPDGTERVLAKDIGWTSLVADDAGWLAWAEDAEGSGSPHIVVFDAVQKREIARIAVDRTGPRWDRLDSGPDPVQFDNGVLYFAGEDGDYRWDVAAGGEPQRVTGPDTSVLAVRGDVRVVQSWDAKRGSGPLQLETADGLVATVPDVGYETLSDDGRFLLVGTNYPTGTKPTVKVYDTAQGQQVPLNLPGDLWIDSATFDSSGRLLVATAPTWPKPTATPDEGIVAFPTNNNPRTTYTCDITQGTCHGTPVNVSQFIVLPRR